MVNIPEEVKDACRRHWAQHQRVRVVCDGKRGTFMLQNGCIPVVLVDGKDGELVSPNLFEKLSGGLPGLSARLGAVAAGWCGLHARCSPSSLQYHCVPQNTCTCLQHPPPQLFTCCVLHAARCMLCAEPPPPLCVPSGKEACKNWQQSIKVEGFTMTGDPSGPGMKMGHFVRIVGIQTSNSATDYGM